MEASRSAWARMWRPMEERVLEPELLDELPFDDPAAMRSREDLQRLNGWLGNFGWFRREIERLGGVDGKTHVVELGAGDGTLPLGFLEKGCPLRYTAIDLAPAPENWPESRLTWCQGDALEKVEEVGGDILFANLFLHHLTDEQLGRLGEKLAGYRAVLCNEPARWRLFHFLGRAFQMVGANYVTRFDMHVSLNAGFRGNEVAERMGLREPEWQVRSVQTPVGFLRMIAERAS
ncbi:MAG: hypothetical protein AAF191_11765 [Verrucomicrobiota bacterium]